MMLRTSTFHELGAAADWDLPASTGRVVVLAPGEEVTLVAFDAPQRVGRRTLERIAQYSVADSLAESIEAVHVVPLARDQAGAQALVVRRSQLDQWLADLSARTIRPFAVLPDYLALPADAESWCVRLSRGRAIVRTGTLEGFSAELDLAGEVLAQRIRTGRTAARCRVLIPQEEADQAAHEPLLTLLRSAGCELEATHYRDGELSSLYKPLLAANLLKGPYDPLYGSIEELSKWWGVAAAAAILGVTYLSSIHVDNLHQERALRQINSQIEQVYREAFVADGPIIDVKLQANRALQRMQADFISTMATAGFMDLLDAARGSLVSDSWQVKALRFRQGNLILEISAANFRELTRLKNQLQDAALLVEEQRAVSSGATVEAVLAVRKDGAHGPS